MAQEWAKSFYSGKQWRQTSKAYMQSKAYICERCGAIAEICHHKKHLNPSNINDPNISLSFDNLEALCRDCHGKEHERELSYTYFNDDGSINRVKDAKGIKEFRQATKDIDELLKDLQLERGEIKSY